MRKVQLNAISSSTADVAMRVFENLDTPRSLAAYLMCKYEEYEQLVSLDFRPSDYLESHSFADDYLAAKLLSKFPGFKLPVDPEEAARKSFWDAERSCEETNGRFRAYRLSPLMAGPLLNQVFHLASRKIAKVLGRLHISEVIDACGWGPGVSSSSKGSHTSVYNKFSDQPGATPDLISAGGHQIINAFPLWSSILIDSQGDEGFSLPSSVLSSALLSVPGNAVAFVPKNAKTHRTIAVEPHLNSFLQRGIGSVMRKRLKRIKTPFGLDLDDQVPNQELAQLGSWDNSLATVDLSAASDTISLELVRELLPEPWFNLCDLARSKFGNLDGKWFRYHKFSSMGNGFTFELETLIFWSLAHSLVELSGEDPGWVRVYGDDIIIPSSCYADLMEVLNFCGFKTNAKKSFHDSPFRESCGKDYFEGKPVRPFFFKEEIKDARNIYRMANAIRRYGCLRNCGFGSDRRFLFTWNYLLSRVPKPLRFMIPDGVGDGGFISCWDEAAPSVVPHKGDKQSIRYLQNGLEGFSFISLVERPVGREYQRIMPGVAMMLWCAGPESFTRGRYNLRGQVSSEARTMHVSAWPNLGPWF